MSVPQCNLQIAHPEPGGGPLAATVTRNSESQGHSFKLRLMRKSGQQIRCQACAASESEFQAENPALPLSELQAVTNKNDSGT